MQVELPMGEVVPSGQEAQDSDPGFMANVPEGHSMHRVLRAKERVLLLLWLTCSGQTRSCDRSPSGTAYKLLGKRKRGETLGQRDTSGT